MVQLKMAPSFGFPLLNLGSVCFDHIPLLPTPTRNESLLKGYSAICLSLIMASFNPPTWGKDPIEYIYIYNIYIIYIIYIYTYSHIIFPNGLVETTNLEGNPPPYLHVGFVPLGFVEPSPTKAGCAKGAALLSTDLVKVRELLSFPFRTPTVKKLWEPKRKGKKPTRKHTFCHGLRREKIQVR